MKDFEREIAQEHVASVGGNIEPEVDILHGAFSQWLEAKDSNIEGLRGQAESARQNGKLISDFVNLLPGRLAQKPKLGGIVATDPYDVVTAQASAVFYPDSTFPFLGYSGSPFYVVGVHEKQKAMLLARPSKAKQTADSDGSRQFEIEEHASGLVVVTPPRQTEGFMFQGGWITFPKLPSTRTRAIMRAYKHLDINKHIKDAAATDRVPALYDETLDAFVATSDSPGSFVLKRYGTMDESTALGDKAFSDFNVIDNLTRLAQTFRMVNSLKSLLEAQPSVISLSKLPLSEPPQPPSLES